MVEGKMMKVGTKLLRISTFSPINFQTLYGQTYVRLRLLRNVFPKKISIFLNREERYLATSNPLKIFIPRLKSSRK